MPRRRSRSAPSPALPSALQHVLRSCEAECPIGHAEALDALVGFAIRKVPVRGIFDPGMRDEPDLDKTVEEIAKEHFQLATAQRKWRRAVKAAHLELSVRDDLETACLEMQIASDTSYFYAGLAFGLTFGYVYRPM
jgi:hypothetical protein